MNRTNKLKKIVRTLSPDKVDFSVVDNELNALKRKLTDTVNIQTVEDVTRKLKQFEKVVLSEIDNIRNLFADKAKELEGTLKSKNELLVKASEARSVSQITSLSSEIANLKNELTTLEESRRVGFEAVLNNLDRIREFSKGLNSDLTTLKDGMVVYSTKEESKKIIKDTETLLDELRSEMVSRFSKMGGGAPNQQINVNSSVMSTRFADINFVSNTAIQWSATDDTTNKRVNLTASLISGGAGGSGNPAGNNTEIQFNDSGSFGASTGFTWNKNTSVLSTNEGIVEGHAFRGDATDGGFLQTNNGIDIVSFGPANTANVTFYGNVNMSSLLTVTSTLSGSGVVLSGDAQARGVVFRGATSGTVRVIPASVAGNWLMTLPTTDGSANQVLTTDGNGITTWASVAATGGSGITRNVSIITANTTGADSASTDYVYFVNEPITFTLPTAVANSNLYTVKANTTSIAVATSAGETIDGSNPITLTTNESRNFISNNSVWGVM